MNLLLQSELFLLILDSIGIEYAMKRILWSCLVLIPLAVTGQVMKPILWEHSVVPADPNPGDEIELVFKATIDPKWYLYSSDFDPEVGPMVTTFEFESSDD
ncbi:MAG TPA: hypothetical protein VGA21_01180, partial [Cyclobacteriaceae bacterium]